MFLLRTIIIYRLSKFLFYLPRCDKLLDKSKKVWSCISSLREKDVTG